MDQFIGFIDGIVHNDWAAKIIAAVLIVVATGVIARYVAKFMRRMLQADGSPLPSSSIFVNIVRAVIWFLGVCMMLSTCFAVDVNGIIAALGVGGIAVSLGFQDTLSNLIGGLQVSLMKIVQPGDNIEVGAERGIVRDVTWRHTTIVNSLGETVIIPNSIIGKNALVQLPPVTQVTVAFVLSDKAHDLDEAARKIADACAAAAGAVAELTEPPRVIFSEVTEFGFRGKVLFSVADASTVAAASDATVRAIAPLTRV